MALKVGIIGGTGLEDPDILSERKTKDVNTPFGKPSDVLVTGKIQGVPCVLLARHGRQRSIFPSNVNYRANIYALQAEGCTHMIVTTACGSLQEHIHPGDLVFIDQFIDRTSNRKLTLYDGTEGGPSGVCHMQMDEPFCQHTRSTLMRAADTLGLKYHPKGTVVTIEGPRFSSKAESYLYRSWNCDLVNMTTIPEVTLAKEAGLCYASIALPTDYDCWKGEPVNVKMVMKTLEENSKNASHVIQTAVGMLAQSEGWKIAVQKAKDMVEVSVMLPQ